ncbi:catabolite control protein A [Candidatus Atribacteria bacterium HGW-Atribacteria-1]|nr:MAG: catabolite control protein A [Candidatus Atribacteria bacterium HGW-Atribacteria-1]
MMKGIFLQFRINEKIVNLKGVRNIGGIKIKDVAKKAGVGVGTVSRVLNNKEHVKSATRERVIEAIKELDYQPHAIARSLSSKRTNTITVYLLQDFTGFRMNVIRGIQSELRKFNFDIILNCLDDTQEVKTLSKKVQSYSIQSKTDGCIIISLLPESKLKPDLISKDYPVVLIDSQRDKFSSVYIDNVSAAYNAVSYLFQLGHRSIGYLMGVQSTTSGYERLLGVKKFYQEKGITLDNKFISIDHFTFKAGYKATKKFLSQERTNSLTAIFAVSDYQAAGAEKVLKEAGLRVPDDISLIGFDNKPLAEYLDLTTFSQPIYDMGVLGANIILKELGYLEEFPKMKFNFEMKVENKNNKVHIALIPKMIFRKSVKKLG